MSRTWQKGAALGLAFLAAAAVLVIFGYKAARHVRELHWEGQPIHSWMSVPFIAHTHHVPTGTLYAAIGVAPRDHDRRPIRALAREQRRPVEEVIRDLEKAIAKEHGKAP